jgi:hypothetical protein
MKKKYKLFLLFLICGIFIFSFYPRNLAFHELMGPVKKVNFLSVKRQYGAIQTLIYADDTIQYTTEFYLGGIIKNTNNGDYLNKRKVWNDTLFVRDTVDYCEYEIYSRSPLWCYADGRPYGEIWSHKQEDGSYEYYIHKTYDYDVNGRLEENLGKSYVYLEFDSHGNWTKREEWHTCYMTDCYFIATQTREITYYDTFITILYLIYLFVMLCGIVYFLVDIVSEK